MTVKKVVIFGSAAIGATVAALLLSKVLKKEDKKTNSVTMSCDICENRDCMKNSGPCLTCCLNCTHTCKFKPHPVLESIKDCKVKEG